MLQGFIGECRVIAFVLTRQQDMQSIMKIIAPLRVVKPRPVLAPLEQVSLVGFVLKHQMHMPLRQLSADGLGQFDKKMFVGVILERVYGIEPQPVKAIIAHPHEGIFDQELPHKVPVISFKINRWSPAGRMVIGEERLGISV